jgi:hypothetical protein
MSSTAVIATWPVMMRTRARPTDRCETVFDERPHEIQPARHKRRQQADDDARHERRAHREPQNTGIDEHGVDPRETGG